MISWKHYFKGNILDRGKTYFKKGLVQNVEKNDERYTAEVIGSVPYHVSIWKKANNQLGMTCTCPYAKDGNKCKHMAALCMAIEEKQGNFNFVPVPAKNPDRQVKPFPAKNKPNSRDYTYYDLAVMTRNFVFMESRVNSARKLIEKGAATLIRVDFGYQNREKVGIAFVRYQGERGTQQITVRFNQDEIITVYCNVAGCNFYYENRGYYKKDRLCVHGTAALLLLADYIDRYNPGDSTDENAMEIMGYYQVKHRSQVMGSVGDVKEDLILEPRLEKNYEGFFLSFKTGIDKTFVIKNLTEFVDLVENEQSQQFGSKTQISYAMHKIGQTSMDYYRYLKEIVFEEQSRIENGRRTYDYSGEEIQGKLALYGRRLDHFFDIVMEHKAVIAYSDKLSENGRNALLSVAERSPKIMLQIQPEYDRNNIFTGIHIEGEMPEILQGESYYYNLEGQTLSRIDKDMAEGIKPLLRLEYDKKVEFGVGRKSLSEFYYHTMPALQEYVDFAEKDYDTIERYLSPKAVFRFYLDAEKNEIICQAKVIYGETEYNLAEHYIKEGLNLNGRDLHMEDEALFHVLRYFPRIDKGRGLFVSGEEEEAAYAVLDTGIPELMLFGEVFCTDKLKKISVRRKPKVSVGVSLQSGIMNLEISSEDISREELWQILDSYRKKKKYFRMKNGDFLNLEDENIDTLASLVDTLHISSRDFTKDNMKIPAYRALYLDTMLQKNESLYIERDKHFKELIKEFKTISDSQFEVPTSLQKIMRSYQSVGFRWLKTLEEYGFGGILADDMGLGKTLQVISVLLSAKQENKKGVSLIISPASLIYNWQEEFSRFAKVIKTLVVSGGQKERQELIKNYEKYDVVITSYDLLKRDIAEYEDKRFLFQIIDEAQYIKNHTTAVAKAVKCITAKTRYALTGTPIENRLSELWSIFDFLMPGFLYGYETFRKELEQPIVKYADEEASKRLKKMVSPFILRRIKEDVLKDLPEKLEEVQYAGFDELQQKLYDGQVLHMKQLLTSQDNEGFQKNKIQILAELTKLRQLCCDPSLLYENYEGESSKRQACIHLIQSAIEGGHRMLVFSQFTSMLALLEENLKKEKIEYYKITGSTPKEERIRLVKDFNERTIPVFLISLKAGGTGLNLTGADIVIHYDPWWNQAVQNQATDRAHRIGQKKVVTVYKLIVKNTIEENIMKLQEAKKNLADEILSGENGGLAGLTREELLSLL